MSVSIEEGIKVEIFDCEKMLKSYEFIYPLVIKEQRIHRQVSIYVHSRMNFGYGQTHSMEVCEKYY